MQKDPSDIGSPLGAPKPIPVPSEIIEAALRDFNEEEIIKDMDELLRDGGCQLQDILPFLEKAIGSTVSPQEN
jgi:hypothetical protein